ncbi:MAG: FdtA/QdtA family cupin domain-containing protein [Lachnospiraceae bacterium]|nr:FdtA/QdtA family cupin domain-containing protein [Lachnospiraceae bacterium]
MKTINDVKLLEFPQIGDHLGHLIIVENNKDIPFAMKRIFYIYGSDPLAVRGRHANRNSSFCLINVCGTSKVKAIDTKGQEKIITLDRPHIGVFLPPMIWKEMYDFSPDSILLVLSDELYDEQEYIRDFGEFLHLRA